MRRSRLLLLWALAVSGGFVVSCGSRTGLFGEGPGPNPSATTSPTSTGTGIVDGAPPTDAPDLPDTLPPLDVMPIPDVDRRDCPDADATFIYVVTEESELYSFYPPALDFKLVGKLACPAPGATPFSMAVDRKGVAYVLFTDGKIYRVSTLTGACIATPYAANQLGWETFGMGFASDTTGPAEKLYVAHNTGAANGALGVIDTSTFKLAPIGSFSPEVPRAELTGTGDGRLYAYWPLTGQGLGSRVAEIDKQTAKVIGVSQLPIGSNADAFAFAFWGGDFWIFSGRGGTSVSKYSPATNDTTTPTTHPSTIVGAGVSTCAPQE